MSIRTGIVEALLDYDLAPYLHEHLEDGFWSFLPYQTIAARQLKSSLFKKFQDNGCKTADDAALDLFKRDLERVRGWKLELNSYLDEYLYGEFSLAIDKFFHPSDTESGLFIESFQQLFEEGAVGPGSSRLASGEDFYTKFFSSVLSTTHAGLYSSFRASVDKSTSSWSTAETLRSTALGTYVNVPGNKLSFAPKNVNVSRIIAVEPSLNMFYQLGLGKIISKRLKTVFGIDITSQQEKNRELARLGSIDGSLSTLDLSSASDSISYMMCKGVIPKDIFWLFDLLRSPFMELPNGEQVELPMLSTMGNGFTFPLMTALLACVVSSAATVSRYSLKKPRAKALGNFGIYGDDIICPVEITGLVKRLLGLLGFVVNEQKSFSEGPFRESCGRDWFLGRTVRGVYIKTLNDLSSRFAAINLLNAWSSQTGIYLPRTVGYLLKTVMSNDKPQGFRGKNANLNYVPPYCGVSEGLLAPFILARARDSVNMSQDGFFRFRKLSASRVYLSVRQEFDECGNLRQTNVDVPKEYRKRYVNEEGILVSILHGSIINGKVALRQNAPSFHWENASTPSWESSIQCESKITERGDLVQHFDAVEPIYKKIGVTSEAWMVALLRNGL